MNIYIGLGGIGAKAIEKLAITGEQKAKYIVIDSDMTDIRRISEQNNQIRSVCISTKHSIGECLNFYPKANEWYPSSPLLVDHLCVSASAIRANGRLLIEIAMINKLRPIFEELLLEEQEDISIHYYTSTMGGTGSGAFLPLVFFLNEYCKEKKLRSVKMYGHFTLPSAVDHVISSKIESNYLWANTFAFIIELEAFTDALCGKKSIDISLPFYEGVSQGVFAPLLNGVTFAGLTNADEIKSIDYIRDLADSKVSDMNYEKQKKILSDTKQPYMDTYITMMPPLNKNELRQERNCNHITHHIDRRWHEILKGYVIK